MIDLEVSGIVVVEKDSVFTASCPDIPGVSYSSKEQHDAVRWLRCHILRDALEQTEIGSAPAWVKTVLPVT